MALPPILDPEALGHHCEQSSGEEPPCTGAECPRVCVASEAARPAGHTPSHQAIDRGAASVRALAFLRATRGYVATIRTLAARGSTPAEERDGWQVLLRAVNDGEARQLLAQLSADTGMDDSMPPEETIEDPSCDQSCDETLDESCDDSCDTPI